MNASGFENLVGSIYGDNLTGDSGDNILAGVAGNDTLIGGDGNDTLYGDGTIHADTHGTGFSGPIVTVADSGAAGNDVLIGGKGNDSLYGGAGNDVMSGGQGQDVFVFGGASGDDVITDFGGGQDTILFEAESGVTDFSQLTFTKSGNSVIVTWGTDDSIVLEGVKPKDISAASFQFEGSSIAAMALPEFDKGLIVDSWSGPTDYLI
jgi:Ca2+-binding RTX toxin-like protein